MPSATPLLNVVFVQRIIKYVSPRKIDKPLELANVCQLWAETSSEYFAAAHVWSQVLSQQRIGTTLKLYMLMSMAAAHGSAWIVFALTEAGINPKAGNPLNVACRYGHGEIVKMLLECSGTKGPDTKLDFNFADHGFTPLQHSVLYKDIALVEMLLNHYKKDQENFNLEAKTSTSEPDFADKTALQLAQTLRDFDDKEDPDLEKNDQMIENEEIKKALEENSKSRKQIIVDLLLDAGAKIVGKNTETKFPAPTQKKNFTTNTDTNPNSNSNNSKFKVAATPLSCLKCKLKFVHGNQSYRKCSNCDAVYCSTCAESTLYYQRFSGVLCRSCAEHIANLKKS